jgi:hypothetical protein
MEGGRVKVKMRVAGARIDRSRAREGMKRVPGRDRGGLGREKGNQSVQRRESCEGCTIEGQVIS